MAVRAAATPKFHGRKTLRSKVKPQYPSGIEREYLRVANAFMTQFNLVLAEYLPEIRKVISAARESARADGSTGVSISAVGAQLLEQGSLHEDEEDVLSLITRKFSEIWAAFELRAEVFGLHKKLDRVANMNSRLSIREWRRAVKNTLGLDIARDYYSGEFYRGAIKLWSQRNVNLIKTIPKDALGQMQKIVLDGYMAGRTSTDIGREIQQAYGLNRNKAQFIARDQTAKLNAELAQAQQTDAGVTEYVWSSSGDSRVRDCHVDFDGKHFKWAEPPDNWYNTKSKGRVYVGKAHPGQAPICRCVALPVFNIEGLSLPWEGTQ